MREVFAIVVVLVASVGLGVWAARVDIRNARKRRQ